MIHPIIQFSATLLALYAFYHGLQRFRSVHLKQKRVFNWKRHVLFGQIAFGAWLIGLLVGMAVVNIYWHGFLMTGVHGTVAVVLAPFILFGLFSGLHMDRNRKKRRLLPLVHGLNNIAVLVLALTQLASGWGVYKAFVLGN